MPSERTMIEAESQPAPPARHWLPGRQRIMRILRSSILRALVSAQVIAALVIVVRDRGWLQPMELSLYDALRVAWTRTLPLTDVTLVGMTEADIHRWQYPFPDDVLADLLERIASGHPRAIGVDIYRDIPVPPSTGKLDTVLKAHPEIFWVFKLAEGHDGSHPEIAPPKALAGTDRATLADIATDPGDVARRGLLYADDGTNNYTGLGMALAQKYLADEHILPEAGDNDSVKLGKSTIPPLDTDRGPYMKFDDRGYQVLLDYKGGAQPFPLRTVAQVMDDDESALMRDRVVIVGDALESVKDFFASPFNVGFNADRVYGMAVHGHLVDQLIRLAHGDAKILGGLPRRYEDVWIWACAIGGALLGLAIRSTFAAAGASAAGVGAIGGVTFVAFGWDFLLPMLPATLAWLGAAGFTNQLLHAASNRARQRLRESFERFLPPAVIADLVKLDELPKLGGERREISVIFTDVASFTTFSESLDPEQLATILNEYFEGVCAAIFAHGGLVNAFLGDGVLAFFGAPQAQPDHVDRAVAAAFDIDRFAQRFSDEQQAQGRNFLHTRIGIHTGWAFVGNVGSSKHLQYTALGDILNTASRLEGLNKAIGTRICVSGDIANMVTEYRCRPIGAFIVKGRHGATEVFEPIDPQRYPAEWIDRYDAAYQALATAAPGAAAMMEGLHGDNDNDPCVAFHIRRLEAGETGVLTEMHEK